MTWILLHQTWQTNLLWPMDLPSESRIDDFNTATPNLADKPTLAKGSPKWIKIRWLEYCYTKLARQTYIDQWTQLVLTSGGQDVFKFGRYTPISAGRSTCHQYWYLEVKNAISYCNWYLVVTNGNFTFLLTSSGQEWLFHIATDI